MYQAEPIIVYEPESANMTTQEAYYSPPWADMSIISIAGSSGSGKTSLARAIIDALNLPWVLIMSMDSFYKVLTPEQSRKAFLNEYDFDSPKAIDFEVLVGRLKDLKEGYRSPLNGQPLAIVTDWSLIGKRRSFPSIRSPSMRVRTRFKLSIRLTSSSWKAFSRFMIHVY